MEIIYLDINETIRKRKLALCVGFFDGLHLGHMTLVKKTIEIARAKGLTSAMLTLNHDPLFVLGYKQEETLITSIEDKRLLLQNQLDIIYILKFDKATANLSPEEFINRLLLPLGVQELICGFDYRFGKAGSAKGKDIDSLSAGKIKVSIVPEYQVETKKASSSVIHELLASGEIEVANKILGRNYSVSGKIIKGFGAGKSSGFPTMNIELSFPYRLPRNGVYAVKVGDYFGMANIGYHPTINPIVNVQLEVHLFNYQENAYGQEIRVEFFKYIRDEQKWNSMTELAEQLKKDQENIRQYFRIK